MQSGTAVEQDGFLRTFGVAGCGFLRSLQFRAEFSEFGAERGHLLNLHRGKAQDAKPTNNPAENGPVHTLYR